MVATDQTRTTPPGKAASGPRRGTLALALAVLGALALRNRLGREDRSATPGARRAGAPSGHQQHHAGTPGGGREAARPSEIPAAGWRGLVWRIYDRFQADRVMLIAAGVTYYGLLALFPAIAALVSLFGLFADPARITQQLSALEGVLPSGAIEVIGSQISRIQGQGGGTLGLYFFIGLAISLWSANAGVKSVFDALNVVYGEPERRSFVAYNFQALLFTLGAIAVIMLAIGGIVVMPAVFAFIGLEGQAGRVISLLRWPVLLAVILFGLALLYRYGPSREVAQWRWVTWGSGFAAIVWLIVSALYSWYVSSFGTFNETYGSLGAVIGFLIWMWISATIVLIGAEVNAQLERRAGKDTATQQPRPTR